MNINVNIRCSSTCCTIAVIFRYVSLEKNSNNYFTICINSLQISYTNIDLEKRAINLLTKSVKQEENDLIIIALNYFAQKFSLNFDGLTLNINLQILSNYGLGSSSALIYSIAQILNIYYEWNLSESEILEHSIEIEHYQHGKSSGLDLLVISSGKPLFYQKNNLVFSPLTINSQEIAVVFSGKSKNSTAECLNHVNALNLPLSFWQEYTIITLKMQEALKESSNASFIELIKASHKLLSDLGVVPKKIMEFISYCELFGGAAKICGSGAVSGSSAGAILVSMPSKEGKLAFEQLCKKYNYDMQYFTINS
ncbi:MAG: hypothetical protein RCG15_00340 [Candidatus Rickettsia vulgarisii]